MTKLIITFVALFLLSACASDVPMVVKQEPDALPPINLDVLTVVALDRSNAMIGASPYATNNFKPTIANALRKWATEKLIVSGNTGEATFVIRDASLRSMPIPHPDSMFTREQTSKYVAHVEVDLDVVRGGEHGRVVAEADQFVTLPDEPTVVERQNAYNKILNAVINEISENVRTGGRNHLQSFVRPAPK